MGKWEEYERRKKALADAGLSWEEYGAAVLALARELGL